MKNSKPDGQSKEKAPSTKIVWETYLWLLFVLQMLNWVAVWAGDPAIVDYLDPNIKIPGWIAALCYFRGNKVFETYQWKGYFIALMSWEVIYGILTVTGMTGTPALPEGYPYDPGYSDLLVNFLLLAPYYMAVYKISTEEIEEANPSQ